MWGVLAERKMRAHCVIVVHVTGEHMSQVMFAEHDHMVEAFAADRADQALSKTVLPGERADVG